MMNFIVVDLPIAGGLRVSQVKVKSMNILKSVKEELLVPIHPAGWPFIFLFWLITMVVGYFWNPFFLPGSFLSLWCIYFFRNPKRTTPVAANFVISPADGRVLSNGVVDVPDDLPLPDGEWRRISIFMNVFDVHVNRSPMQGKVTYKNYVPGSFLNASMDKASSDNERLILGMETENGKNIAFVQIAGLVARRIICDVDIGSHLRAGEVFGLIRFGSRVDIYFPSEVSVMVLKGQKMIAGETIIGDFTKSSKSVKEKLDEE